MTNEESSGKGEWQSGRCKLLLHSTRNFEFFYHFNASMKSEAINILCRKNIIMIQWTNLISSNDIPLIS